MNRAAVPQVELVYDVDCPNIALARANLLAAFSLAGLPPRWSEHRIGDPTIPPHARGYGSPTILVAGLDVAGTEPESEACCRIYAADGRASKAPSIELIAAAMSRLGDTIAR
jgi:mercuric ion transport protein